MTPSTSAPFRAARAAYHHLKGKNRFTSAFRQDRAVFHAFKKAIPAAAARVLARRWRRRGNAFQRGAIPRVRAKFLEFGRRRQPHDHSRTELDGAIEPL